jgi:trk system potassium uptake protein
MKQYLVIGLGRFGTSVAQTLYESNEEVLALDIDEELVQEAINSNIVDNAVVMDATDVKSLKELGVSNYDIAFVCTGDIEPSIMITLNLKELGIEKIIAKAVSKSHGKVLAKIGATKVKIIDIIIATFDVRLNLSIPLLITIITEVITANPIPPRVIK